MKQCQRIEIVIESPLVETMVELLRDLGTPGYTLVSDVRGQGDRGVRWADELSGDTSNSLFIIASGDPEVTQRILDRVRPLLSRSGGICLVSDAMWLKH